MKKLLITTTDSLYGWEIETYLQPVFASVVIGANVFADWGASFTDFFGGRSSGYEKRLQLIKDNAIEMLSSKAGRLGANCILGLKIDMDEISGKGTQMFMITAVGMAVIAKSSNNKVDSKNLKEIDKGYVIEKANVIRLSKKFEKVDLVVTAEELKTMIESRSGEFKDLLIGKLKLYYTGNPESAKSIKEYFSVIDPEDAIAALYPVLFAENDAGFIKEITNILKDNDLIDYNQIDKFLQGDLEKKKLALNLLLIHKPSYYYSDIKVLKEVIEKLETSFPKVSTLAMKKGFLSSGEKEVWTCICNSTNALDVKNCSNCSRDEQGFKSDEFKPSQVINTLANRITALESLLDS